MRVCSCTYIFNTHPRHSELKLTRANPAGPAAGLQDPRGSLLPGASWMSSEFEGPRDGPKRAPRRPASGPAQPS